MAGSLVGILLLSSSVFGAEEKPLLQGKVSHSHWLEPLPSSYRTGTSYQDDNYRQIPGNDWFRIPSWLAGVWSNKSGVETTTYYHDHKVHRKSTVPSILKIDPVNSGWGSQTDSSGQVWHYTGAPYSCTEHLSERKQNSITLVYQLIPIKCTNSQFIVRYRSHYVVVDETTKNVVKSFSVEEFQSLNMLSPNRLMCESDMAHYDENGKLYYEQKVVRFLDKVRDYSPVQTSSTGQDLKMLFRQYLNSVGLSNLAPTD